MPGSPLIGLLQGEDRPGAAAVIDEKGLLWIDFYLFLAVVLQGELHRQQAGIAGAKAEGLFGRVIVAESQGGNLDSIAHHDAAIFGVRQVERGDPVLIGAAADQAEYAQQGGKPAQTFS